VHRLVRGRALALLLALALIVPLACGGDDSGSPEKPRRLSAAEESIISRAQETLHGYCRKVGLYITRRQPLPTVAETQQVTEQLDRLIGLARERPGARNRRGETVRDVLGGSVEDLEGANCSAVLERKLAQAFATIPPQ
jgi:hypothetical protein